MYTNVSYSKEESYPHGLEPKGSEGEDPKERMASATQKTDSVQMLMDLLVDGGNTESLATDIQTSYPPEAWELYSSLLGKSPYLSDTVMKSAVKKENVLPPEMVTDVLVANPQSAKSSNVLFEVENRMIPLTEEQKESIMQNWYISGAKESLESKLSDFNADYASALYDLLFQFRFDSVSPNPQDSIIDVLEGENSLWAKYMLVSEYHSQGNCIQSENTLNAIPTLFELTEKELAEYQDYQFLYDVLYDITQQGLSITELTSLQKELLYSIAAETEDRANAFATSILQTAETLLYEEPVLLPSYLKSSAVIPIPVQKSADKNKLFVFPNPAIGYFIVRYELDNNYSEAIIQITNISGENVKQFKTTITCDYLVVPTQGLSKGNYFVKLILNGIEVGLQKLIIQ